MMTRLTNLASKLNQHLLTGKSEDQETRHREFILNVLLWAIILACFASGCLAVIDEQISDDLQRGNNIFNIGVLFVAMFILWHLSRTGRHIMAAYIFLACLSLVALNLVLSWSFELPTAELASALLVVIAGLILRAGAALRVTIITVASLLAIGYAQIVGSLRPNVSWLNQRLELSNIIDYCLLITVLGIVSWLAHLEIDRYLEHTRRSELALSAERDSLEARVAERTRELEQTQLARMLELQHLAEFGRLSAQLLHEVANPLTAASINLELVGQEKSQALQDARQNLQQLERYIEAARRQLKCQSQVMVFCAQDELRHLLAVLKPLAECAKVQLIVKQSKTASLYGDPVRFNQIVANLVVNAIDSYSTVSCSSARKRVELSLKPANHELALTVKDWGKGIIPEQLPQLFKPFYTTKPSVARGLGLGLAIVKQTVENDFGGSIKVSSSPSHGTAFHVLLKLHDKTLGQQSEPATA